MEHIYLAPFMLGHEKTASVGDGINKLAHAMVVDADAFGAMMSQADIAYEVLGDYTREKLASGVPLSAQDVHSLSESEVAALTVLGDEAMDKVAAYDAFYMKAAQAEDFGRQLAREVYYTDMLKQAAAQQQLVKQAAAVGESPEFKRALAKQASAEIARRQSERTAS